MNMISKYKILFIAVFAAFGAASNAHAVHLNIYGMGNYAKPVISPEPTTLSGKFDLGGGAALSIPFGMMSSLDFGAHYVRRKYEFGAGDERNLTAVEFPILFRLWLAQVISFGFGGYYGMNTGNVPANYTKSDYGLVGSFALDIPMGMVMGLVLDARYVRGLADLNKSAASTYKTQEMQGLIGFRFGLPLIGKK